mgnify:CR=1 FL=1
MFSEQKYLVSLVKRFVSNEQGAVTIDWVILTAGVVVMAIGAITVFGVDNSAEVGGIKVSEMTDAELLFISMNPNLTGGFGDLSPITKVMINTKAKVAAFRMCISDEGSTVDMGGMSLPISPSDACALL